jgi:hypothetical protein
MAVVYSAAVAGSMLNMVFMKFLLHRADSRRDGIQASRSTMPTPCDVAASSNFAYCSLFNRRGNRLFTSGRVTPMSIQEFHSQLTQVDQPNAIMGTLIRLTQADDQQVAEQLAEVDMGIWDSGLSAR